jgi:transcriptional regulator with PAS, ATPase and Fis domain
MARTLEASGAHALAAGQAELAETLRARLRSASAEASAAPAAMRADGAQLVEIIDQLVAMRVSPEYAAREFGNLIEATFGRTPTTGVVEDGVFHLLAGNEETGRELLVYASGRKPIPADCPLFRFDFSGMEEQQLWIHLPGAMDEGMSGRMPILLPIFGLVVETARLRAAEAGRRPMELAASPSELGLIGNGEGIRRVAALIERMRLSKSEIPTLILGESGTGKDVTARAIHRTSPRKQEPFVAFNCAAVEKSLLLSELFGHVKGAFTGADRNSMGLVRTADKGTLFLDEIGDLPLDQQPALLRFLEQREVRPVGSNAVHQVDVRVIAATNRNLTRMIEEGSFREDLYHRLAGIVISLPPLRERLEDLEALTHHFLKMAQAESRKSVQISQGAFEALRRHTWPGNVRELRQTIQRVVSLAANGGTMEESDLNIESVLGRAAGTGVSVRERTPAEGGTLNIQGLTLKDAVDKARIAAVRLALEETGCNVQKTAKILQIEPMTVYAICKKGGLKIAREVRAKKA